MHRMNSGLLLPNELEGVRTVSEHGWPEEGLILAFEGWRAKEYRGVGRYKREWTYNPIAGADRQGFRVTQEPTGSQLTADATAITGTAEALMWPAVLTSIPANTLKAGQHVIVTAFGVSTTPGSAATTMTINPRYGTTTGGTSMGISNTSPTTPISQTAVPWTLQWIMTVRSIGTAANLLAIAGSGTFSSVVAGTTTAPGTLVMGGTTLSTADSTTAQGIVFGAILGGSASWTLTTKGVCFEIAN